jgi:methionyl-tRNA synthetase
VVLVAETDGYLTANAPWKKPPERSDADHAKLQARVLATAAEAIRIITALAYPILPDAAAKVWLQLGQGEIADAAKHGFLSELAWGGLKAGTKFGEPAPLFPARKRTRLSVCRILRTKTTEVRCGSGERRKCRGGSKGAAQHRSK